MVQETLVTDEVAPPPPPKTDIDADEVTDAAEAQEAEAGAQPLPGADAETPGAEAGEAEPAPPSGDVGQPLDVRHYASMLALQPENITVVPEELREEAKVLSEQIRQNLMREAETRAQQEVQQRHDSQQIVTRYRAHWDDGDLDTINKLRQDEPEMALHFLADLYNQTVRRVYEKNGQPMPAAPAPAPQQQYAPQQNYTEAEARIIQEGQAALKKLAERPDAQARIVAEYYSVTEPGLARLLANVERELARDPAAARIAAQEGRRGLPRVDTSPGMGRAPVDADKKLLDPDTPIDEIEKIMAFAEKGL